MKIKNLIYVLVTLFIVTTSCEKDFLEQAPQSAITPANYLWNEDDLATYSIDRYNQFPDRDNPYATDGATDIMVTRGYSAEFVPGEWKVGQSGGDWSFGNIYQCNYFLETVLPRYYAGELTGGEEKIRHYIGEMYFMRAYAYFGKLQTLGDFPIVTTRVNDNLGELIAASKREPRTEVARFILSDLDSAIAFMSEVSPDGGKKNRLSKKCAQLFKSRVALYEGTWLKYFKGTAFVPNGPGWPGKEKAYNANYEFPSGSIDGEIDFFLTEAMEASKAVADAVSLTPNNMVIQQDPADPENPYFNMFSDEDLSGYGEVLFWRAFDKNLGITNNTANEVAMGNSGHGFTRGFVDGFLMDNGLPIYAAGSGYAGDDSIHLVRQNRDGRLQLFLKEPGQKNILFFDPTATHSTPVEPYPDIMNKTGHGDYPTGYSNRKGLNYDEVHGGNFLGFTGEIVFRAAEAYLNYIEASYEKTGALDADAITYWQAVRERAGTDTDIQKTINATDLSKEAANNWSVYSGGKMVDATLYNIRRERMCELLAEGFRKNDLRRWRSYDQLIEKPYHIEGFKLWGPMQYWYAENDLTYGKGNSSTVSDPALSEYLRVYQRRSNWKVYNGLTWNMAHYLNPIANEHFLITSGDNNVDNSPIYQNPGWPAEANAGPIGF